ncbi:hypothetical protein N7510_000799 [Penicillium lagena]|uniref:uncharacterized protein n=1 Tax=Penicillium lagena TaxID=94218 RepID=UPI00253FC1D6|nr:uncharacterized protein N7510_000799 [Penicillium lagena]KAJ5624490.1 hypothetical protein N7510_000799 [Penicillium lagena]
MNHSPPRKIHRWHLATAKLHLKRGHRRPSSKAASDDLHKVASEVGDGPLEDQKDGFYRYSESLLEEEEKSLALALQKTRSSHETNTSSSGDYVLLHGQMALSQRPSRPYRVSSDEWVIPSTPSTSPRVLSLDDLSDVQLSIHFGNVLNILIKLYAMAKLLQVVFLSYGVELDVSENSLMFWIDRTEAEIRTQSLALLIHTTENLYYSLYARVVLEMANIELCSCFNIDVRPRHIRQQFILPDADHLYRIFLVCKDALDGDAICEALQQGVVMQHQEDYINHVTAKEAAKGFATDDLLGYRRYALSIVSERSSDFCKKWEFLTPFFCDTPPEIITILSEKYLTAIPKRMPDVDRSYHDLPFTDPKTIDPVAWEKEIIQNHRLATLAKLEGKSIGDERLADSQFNLLHLAQEHKCICSSVCSCAHDCTMDVERPCPCAERQLRMLLAKGRTGPGSSNFINRMNGLARSCFEELAMTRRDATDENMIMKLGVVFEMFDLEVHRERTATALSAFF